MTEKTGALLGDDCGLGKTVQAISAAKNFNGPVLVVCRPLNKPYWKQTIKEWDPGAPVRTAGIAGRFDLTEVATWFGPVRQRGYLLIHHEALRYQFRELRDMGTWEAVIADEAHRFKNRRSQMTTCLKQIPTYHKWALTGTPMEKSPADFWSLLHWFSPRFFTSYWRFYDDFVDFIVLPGPYHVQKVIGPKNMPTFVSLVSPYYLKRTKEEVVPDLPPKIYRKVPIPLNEAQQKLYTEVKHQSFVEMNEFDPANLEVFIKNGLARIAHLQKITLDPALVGNDAPSSKIDWLMEWLQDYPNEPFIIFSHSRAFIKTLPVYLDGTEAIHGEVKQSQRDLVLRRFDEGKIRGIVCTIDTVAESVNLGRAHHAIFTDLHRSSIMMDQAENRVHRINSKSPVQIVRLISPDTVDELVLSGLTKKMSDIELVQQFLKGG